MAREARKASRGSARKVVRLVMYSKSTPSRRNGSKATAFGGGCLLLIRVLDRVDIYYTLALKELTRAELF